MSDFGYDGSPLELTVNNPPEEIGTGHKRTLALSVFSNADTTGEAEIQVFGLDPAWLSFSPSAHISVFPGESANLTLTIDVPADAQTGLLPYTIRATPLDMPEASVEQTFELRISRLTQIYMPAVKLPEAPVAPPTPPPAPVVADAPPPEESTEITMIVPAFKPPSAVTPPVTTPPVAPPVASTPPPVAEPPAAPTPTPPSPPRPAQDWGYPTPATPAAAKPPTVTSEATPQRRVPPATPPPAPPLITTPPPAPYLQSTQPTTPQQPGAPGWSTAPTVMHTPPAAQQPPAPQPPPVAAQPPAMPPPPAPQPPPVVAQPPASQPPPAATTPPPPPRTPGGLVMPQSVMPVPTAPAASPTSGPPAGTPAGMPYSAVTIAGGIPTVRAQEAKQVSEKARFRSTQITIAFEPHEARLGPGENTVIMVRVTNAGSILDTLTLSVTGIAPEWSALAPARLTLQPGESSTAALTIKPGIDARAGESVAFVRAISTSNASEITEEPLRLVIRAQVNFFLKLDPMQGTGQQQVSYTLRCINQGNSPLDLTLTGQDDSKLCTYTFDPPILRAEPQTETQARVVVFATSRTPPNQPRLITFTINATPGHDLQMTRQATGQFQQMPAPPATMAIKPSVVTDVRQGVYTLRINNPSQLETTLGISADDAEDAAIYLFEPALVTLSPGGNADVRLTTRMRKHNTSDAPRDMTFTISANPADDSAVPTPLTARLVQSPVPDVKLALSPTQQSSAGAATFKLIVRNPRPTQVGLELTAADEADACEYTVKPAMFDIAPGQNREVQLRVKPKDALMPDERRKVHVFKVIGKIDDGQEKSEQTIEGRMAQLPGASFGGFMKTGGRVVKILLVVLFLIIALLTGNGACQLRMQIYSVFPSGFYLPREATEVIDTGCRMISGLDRFTEGWVKWFQSMMPRGGTATPGAGTAVPGGTPLPGQTTVPGGATAVPGADTPIPGGPTPDPATAPLGAYNFAESATTAIWRNTDGQTLTFNNHSAAILGLAARVDGVRLEDGSTPARVLQTVPQSSPNGNVSGVFKLPITIQPGAFFHAQLGFLEASKAGRVKIKLWLGAKVIAEIDKSYSGSLQAFDVDLTPFAGQSGEMTLFVLADGDPADDQICWINPRIEQ